ncbi:MAG: Ig-like domain-containing protein [Lachnospiraceae bacterium]|nr:Ig-like domain-containing protein [Lachnospiraceae bacterium]
MTAIRRGKVFLFLFVLVFIFTMADMVQVRAEQTVPQKESAVEKESEAETMTATDKETKAENMTATDKETKAETEPAKQQVKLSTEKKTLYVGQSFTLKLTGTKESDTITFGSSKKSVAKVTKAGKVTAVKAGKANIVATVNGERYTCVVTVKKKVAVKDFTITFEGNELIDGNYISSYVGNKCQFAVTDISPSNASIKTGKFTSGNKSVLTINSKGLATMKSAGTAKVTATVDGVTKTFEVVVSEPQNTNLVPSMDYPKDYKEEGAKYGEYVKINEKAKGYEYYIYSGEEVLPLKISTSDGFSITYKVLDEEIIAAEWGEWKEDNKCDLELKLKPLKEGTAIVEVCDTEDESVRVYIVVHVLRAGNTVLSLETADENGLLDDGWSLVIDTQLETTRKLRLTTDKGEAVVCKIQNKEIVSSKWGKWNKKGARALTLTGLKPGSTLVTVYDKNNPSLSQSFYVVVE